MCEKRNVIIFGDSLLKGVIIKDGRYTVNKDLEWDKIEKLLNVTIQNFSKMGNTIIRGEKDILAYVNEHHKDFDRVILEYGGNDSDYNWQEAMAVRSRTHQPKTNIKIFEQKLCSIIETILALNKGITLMTLPPIIAKRYYNWFTQNKSEDEKENIKFMLGDIEIIYRRQEIFSNVIVKVAHKYNLDIVDVRECFLSHLDFPSLMCEDGIHPNEKGEQLIIQCFLDYYAGRIE